MVAVTAPEEAEVISAENTTPVGTELPEHSRPIAKLDRQTTKYFDAGQKKSQNP